ncbi:MAG TPA: beta-propeller fold lactonase family protein [Steroidobacteraceae bacterium]|nr:beta-propeller fold lactonase family protein [Steroidobacteraceae bacterium]
MKAVHTALALGAIVAGATVAARAAPAIESFGAQHAVFVMTNDADANEVIAYERTQTGTLHGPHKYQTGGRGSGGTVDPLGSQGSLTLSDDGSYLLAANAGSGSVSVFRVLGARLFLTDRVPSGGSEPNAVAQHGKLVYVLNTAGSSSVVGFRLQNGRLVRIPNSQRFLSANFVESSSLAFSRDGRYLVVTERTTNSIDVLRVQADGRLSSITVNPAVGTGTFSVVFAPNGAVLVSETGGPGPNSSTISSYSIASDGKLVPISAAVPTLGAANCWNVVTPDGRFVYTSNAGTSSISGFAIANNGALTPLPGTVVAVNPAGSTNLDIAVSADGAYLYSLNAASGAIGIFQIEQDGRLTNFGTIGGLPAGAGLNGIAAN